MQTFGRTGVNATETIRLYVNITYEKCQDSKTAANNFGWPQSPRALADKIADLSNVSCKTMITHLWTCFGKITQAELDDI
jgi:hypothetical protein